jgi:hypothetical protein
VPTTLAFSPKELVCDLPERIILVESAMVTVIARPSLARSRGPVIRVPSLSTARCNGPGGGHPGCSLWYQRFSSPVLGDERVQFGFGYANEVLRSGDEREPCREEFMVHAIATCSTARRFISVRFATEQLCKHIEGELSDRSGSVVLEGDVDRAASVDDRWVYRFPSAGVALIFDGRAHAARLELDNGNDSESCIAFRLSAQIPAELP